MKTTRYPSGALQYLTVEPDNYNADRDYPMVILLHGFGANMEDLATLAPAISQDGYIYVFPQGPLSFELAPGQTGYAWTVPPPSRALLWTTSAETRDVEDLLADFFQEVLALYQVPAGNVMLGGFSQGGQMTYQYGLTHPKMFAGLAGLSAALPDLEMLRVRLTADRSQPVFIAHGQNDQLVPLENALKVRDFLEAEGYTPHFTEYPMAHQISPQEIHDLANWIGVFLPPMPALPD